MNFLKHKKKKIEYFITKRKYNKLIKQIKDGEYLDEVYIKKTINNYYKDVKFIFFNYNTFPHFDDCIFEVKNKKIQFLVYSFILDNLIKIKIENRSPTLTLNMFEILIESKIANRHTLLNFLLTQKQYAFTKDELSLLEKIDIVRKSIIDSYSLETGIKK